jgi:hypothetical protein
MPVITMTGKGVSVIRTTTHNHDAYSDDTVQPTAEEAFKYMELLKTFTGNENATYNAMLTAETALQHHIINNQTRAPPTVQNTPDICSTFTTCNSAKKIQVFTKVENLSISSRARNPLNYFLVTLTLESVS